MKVKQPQPEASARLTSEHALFTCLHLAADPVQARGLMESGAAAIAYETVTDRAGRLPLLVPMSQVADEHLARGLTVTGGAITHAAVAQGLGEPCERPEWLPDAG